MESQMWALWNIFMNPKKRNNFFTNTINLIAIATLVVMFALSSYAQPMPDFLFMSYNVENLFDTIDNPNKNDNEFLPTSNRNWNLYRYKKKLTNLSKVIIAVSENWHSPDVIGLCEIENDTCLNDLIQKTNLYKLHYKFIHYESEDPRGIDVALLYNEETFVPLSHWPMRVIFDDSTRKTRDILYVKGINKSTKDTIHIFQCHFPSRRGGKDVSEKFRMTAASFVRMKIDSLFAENPFVKIIVAGDFNDYPIDRSIVEGLQAQKEGSMCEQCLINLDDKTAEGTHKFQGEWGFLDQAMVSNGFVRDYEIHYTVFKNDFLLQTSEKSGETSPRRTYVGTFYKGGISDHLPIVVSFKEIRNKR